jgi:RNA polymerase sigma-70 factor, ECF subfamily
MPAEIGHKLVGMLPRMLRYARCVARDEVLAQDLVQTACERALATAQGPGDGVPFEGWVFRILRNLWIDQNRRKHTEGEHVELDEEVDAAHPHGESSLEAKLLLPKISQAIEALPQEQQEVLLLVCVEELAYKDVAQLLGVPMGTVMSRLARARRKLIELEDGAVSA